jgi:AraC-like DNA-binding protein
MRAAISVDDFLARPLGSYLVGATFVYWCARPRLCGFSLWGRPSATDIETIVRAKKYELAPTTPRHASVADGRRLTGIDVAAYEVFAKYVAENHALRGDRIERLAYLAPPTGAVSAVAVGFFQVNAFPYPVSKFDDLPSALAWLGHADDRLAIELEEIQAGAAGGTSLLDALRRLLAGSLDATMADAAHALSLSERTLQRRLQEARTTFQDEVARARITKAETLMAESDRPISAIALDVGFASPQHFSRRFRELHGASPTDWRERTRGERERAERERLPDGGTRAR